ncbi:Tom37 C-terminal domain-containing protein [Calycina marina]|uniref:Tom37 C-terminal domain-containing protein n=1 Tax=Calycina marina TaxID=1763456 RepID=A0A9P7YYU3_9HELO|nr:Tom37 C-terminal domain-containing protein [Calycina marina]
MVLELHVWGPAFSLPSIDAHCLATIAYLQQSVPRGEWELVASSNPALSPTNELPALRNGDTWIGGFRNIFHYIARYSAGDWVLDIGLPEQEGADCIAFSTFLESHGKPLLDLSLYVSSENYSAVTRPLYNTLQTFPLPYLTPPALRASAKARSTHLGLSALDIDSLEDTTSPSIIPAGLRKPRSTVSSLLASSPESAVRIRLDALATAFFEPLQELRGDKRYFVSNKQFTSLDCLLLGYLSLMLLPELPKPWLSKTMKSKFPELCAWTEALSGSVFGPKTTLEDAFLATADEERHDRAPKRRTLPWKEPDNGGVVGVGAVFASGLVDSIPIVGQLRRSRKMRQHGGKTYEEEQSPSWQTLTLVGGLVAGVGLLAGYIFQSESLSQTTSGAEKNKSDGLGEFGEAGAALGIYAEHLDASARIDRPATMGNLTAEPVVEVSL